MSRTDADSQHYKVGIVTEVHGDSLYATNPHGDTRQLSIGSSVFADDKIESREGSSMVVLTSNGQIINIPEDVYDQMLSSAITKELSKSLDAINETQEDSSTEPHSHNLQTTEPYAHNAENPLSNFLKASDIFSAEENPTEAAHHQSGVAIWTILNNHHFALFSTQMDEYSTHQNDDLSHTLLWG